MNLLLQEMLSNADPSQVAGLSRFFKTGPGQYGEGDKFLGIKVPVTREVVRRCWNKIGFREIEECISSEYHEARLAAHILNASITGTWWTFHATRCWGSGCWTRTAPCCTAWREKARQYGNSASESSAP